MTKKIPIILLFTVVIAIVALFAATEVRAEERPLQCLADPYTITPATDVDFPYFSPGPGECGTQDCYVWTYIITGGDLAKINKVHFFIPSFPPNVIEGEYLEGSANHIPLRGVGGLSTDFGELNYAGIVISVTPVSGAGGTRIMIATKSVSTYGMIVPVVSTGKKQLGCVALDANGDLWTDVQGPVGGIVGPGFDISGFVAVADFQDINLPEGGCVRVKRHPVTGCIQNFKRCDSAGTNIQPTTTRPDWLTEDIADFGDPTNLRCRGGMITTSGSPYVYWGWTPPNNYYCIGVYDPNVAPYWWTSPCPY
jgi:hypothetical protein